MSVEQKSDGRTVQLKHVRLSFTDALKDKKKTANTEDAKEKHGCNIILESKDKFFDENKAKVLAAIEKACEIQWKKPKAWKDIQEDNPKRICFRKGERFKNTEGEIYQGYEGNFAITASGPSAGQKRPKLLDRRKRPVAYDDILDVCYGGVYADVIVSLFGTDKGGKGVFCSIEAIRSHEEGERMGGGFNVDDDDFDDLEDGDSFDKDDDDDIG